MPTPSKPALESFVLSTLRDRKGWTQERLAEASGLAVGTIKAYENGYRRPSRERLRSLAAVMGFTNSVVDCALFGLAGVPPIFGEARLATGLDDEEALRLRSAAARVGLVAAEEFEAQALPAIRRQRFEEARAQAAEVCRQLKRLPPPQRGDFLSKQPLPMLYAVVERLCDESRKRAASEPHQALKPANLALAVAEHAPDGREKRFLVGWAWAFVANARRVTSDLPAADEAFCRSDLHLSHAVPAEGVTLPLWQASDMKASLRRDQRRWDEARQLHSRAIGEAPLEDQAHVLLNYATTLELMGDSKSAVEVLKTALPLINERHHPRLFFAQRFNLAVNLIQAGGVQEAESILREVRELAIELGNEIDLMRVLWLTGRGAAAAGRESEALSTFIQVRSYFTTNGLACDAADVALDEAILHLSRGDHLEAKRVAGEIVWIFKAQGIHRDALAALEIFCRAAQLGEITVDLTRDLQARVRRAPRLRSLFAEDSGQAA